MEAHQLLREMLQENEEKIFFREELSNNSSTAQNARMTFILNLEQKKGEKITREGRKILF